MKRPLSIDATIEIAKEIRRTSLRMVAAAKSSHIGSSLSCADILAAVYARHLNYDASQPELPTRDRFIMSKGHAAAAYYATLAQFGYFKTEELDNFCQNGSFFAGHVVHKLPGVEFSTGSLGHGLPLGVGVALGFKRSNKQQRVYALLSDGECDEGAVWESALMAATLKLDNLTVIVDYNKIQSLGRVDEVLPLEPFVAKWQAFNWQVFEVDGHNMADLDSVLKQATTHKDKPQAIIAHTIKGKGVSFMQDKLHWHYGSPSPEELQQALEDIEKQD